MKIKLYYNNKNNCVQMVQDDVLKFHDEGISSTEFLSYFGEDVQNLDDIKNKDVRDIVQGYEDILADFKHNCGEEEIRNYFNNVKIQHIQGELIFSKETE